MDTETVLVEPETLLKEPKRRGRPRRLLDAMASTPVEDNVQTEAPPKKERKPRAKKRGSHVDEIEALLVGSFQIAAIRLGPAMLIPSPMGDDETQKQEKDSIHTAAVYFDKWQQGLSDDSPFVKFVNSAAEISPLIFAVGALGRVAFIKYQMMMYLSAMDAAQQNASQNGNGYN